MKFEVKDKNYCASVVVINKLVELPGANTIQHAIIFGNSIIVSKEAKEGDIGLFFPVETQLSQEFLYNNNLYSDASLNEDPTKKGFFGNKGRVRCCKMMGGKYKSEGFFIPLESLDYLHYPFNTDNFPVGLEFNSINDFLICQKYMVAEKAASNPNNPGNKKTIKINRLVENQYRLMNDTDNLRKNVWKINPNDTISISNKYHGTSWAVGKILVTNIPTWKDKIASFFGVKRLESYYDVIYSSRKVVKNAYLNANPNHYYGMDLWGEIAASVKDIIPKGITLYGECVGYLPTGSAIQSAGGKAFDYGCAPNTYKLIIYRITSTNSDGKVFEFSWAQIKDFCKVYGLNMPDTFYYGLAKDYAPELDTANHWNENFLARIEKDFIKEQDCPRCNNKVPEEGVVISVENLYERNSYKLKNFRFLAKETEELDKGVVDLESSQSVEEE